MDYSVTKYLAMVSKLYLKSVFLALMTFESWFCPTI